MNRPSILLVDDDSELLLSLSRALGSSSLNASITASTTASDALKIQQRERPLVAVIDLSLEQGRGVESGFELLSKLLEFDPSVRVIVVTGHGSTEHGVRALRLGAASFIEKPAEVSHLIALIEDGIKFSSLQRMAREQPMSSNSKLGLIGDSAEAERLREQIAFAASNRQPVLITGETGTGKGVLARLIHEESLRSGNFVACQPNFAEGDMANSEFFGHKKGAFTGASEDRVGLIELAHEGTLFLDELDQYPLSVQVRLLTVLQERSFRAVGGVEELFSNFRLIAALNVDPELALKDGRLRSDFYHRIAHLEIHVPALRDRSQDIPPLARYFVEQLVANEELNVFDISDEAIAVLADYTWPGNVRELRASVEGACYAAAFRGSKRIEPSDIKVRQGRPESTSEGGIEVSTETDYRTQVEEFKVRIVLEALDSCSGNQSDAARMLNMDRSSFRRILARAEIPSTLNGNKARAA